MNNDQALVSEDIIEKMVKIENSLKNIPGAVVSNEKKELGLGCKYNHKFADGCYIREMFIPKGLIIVSEVHKTWHPYFIMSGDVTVKSSNGEIVRIKGPYSGITTPNTKRILMTHEDTLWITVHVTEKTDIEEIGKDILADRFEILELEKVDAAQMPPPDKKGV